MIGKTQGIAPQRGIFRLVLGKVKDDDRLSKKKGKNSSSKMNVRQQRFADAVLSGKTGKDAAIDAGYSAKSAEVQASKMLRIPKVSAYISAGRKKVSDKYEVTRERLVAELARMGFSDMRHYLEFTGNGQALLRWDKMPKEATRAIQEITQEEYIEGAGEAAMMVKKTKFKLHSKIEALKELAKLGGFYPEKGTGESTTNLVIKRIILDRGRKK